MKMLTRVFILTAVLLATAALAAYGGTRDYFNPAGPKPNPCRCYSEHPPIDAKYREVGCDQPAR